MWYVVAFFVVFAVNLMPAFGPPSWAVLVLLKLNWHLNTVTLVILGAAAAACGRYLLARGCRAMRGRLSQKRRDNLAAAQEVLLGHRAGAVIGVGLFALSPLPSAQLFEAAGILTVPLIPLTAAFFAGRIASYAIYVGAATVAQHNYGDVFTEALRSPAGIAIQVALVLTMVALSQFDVRRLIASGPRTSAGGADNRESAPGSHRGKDPGPQRPGRSSRRISRPKARPMWRRGRRQPRK